MTTPHEFSPIELVSSRSSNGAKITRSPGSIMMPGRGVKSRNAIIRYYRTLGLLDPVTIGNYAKTFFQKNIASNSSLVRRFQAQGLPLRKDSATMLYGKSLEDLRALEKQAGKRGHQVLLPLQLFVLAVRSRSSRGASRHLSRNSSLVSRNNQQLPRAVIEKINQLLRSVRPQNANAEVNQELTYAYLPHCSVDPRGRLASSSPSLNRNVWFCRSKVWSATFSVVSRPRRSFGDPDLPPWKNDRPLDCEYLFPLPADASVYFCEADINGRIIRAQSA